MKMTLSSMEYSSIVRFIESGQCEKHHPLEDWTTCPTKEECLKERVRVTCREYRISDVVAYVETELRDTLREFEKVARHRFDNSLNSLLIYRRLNRVLDVCDHLSQSALEMMRQYLVSVFGVLRTYRFRSEASKVLKVISRRDQQKRPIDYLNFWQPLLRDRDYVHAAAWALIDIDYVTVALHFDFILESALSDNDKRSILLFGLGRKAEGNFCDLLGVFFVKRPNTLKKHDSLLRWSLGDVYTSLIEEINSLRTSA